MIRFYKPTIKRKDMDSVLQTMVDEEIGSGSRTQSFIQSFCEKTGSFAGTSFRTYYHCLITALKILGANEESKVGVSPLSPLIYKQVIDSIGAKIVYIDVDRENGCPKAEDVNTNVCDILILYEPEGSIPLKYNSETTYADKVEYSGVKVIEDVSSSIGGHVLDYAKAGDWGDVLVCSLEENDVITGSGGAVLSVKSQLAGELRSNKPDKYNSMTDLNASFASVQLDNLEENSAKRRDIIKTYQQNLSRTDNKQFGLQLIDYESNGFSFSVFLNSKPELTVDFAKKHDVPVKKTFENSLVSVYEGDCFVDFPIAAAYYNRTVSFPVYPFLKDSDLDIIRKVIAHLP